jgi:hypothetical protein
MEYKRSGSRESDIKIGKQGEIAYHNHLLKYLDPDRYDVYSLNNKIESWCIVDFLIYDKILDILKAIELETKRGHHFKGVYGTMTKKKINNKYSDLSLTLKGFDKLRSKMFTIEGNDAIQNRLADSHQYVAIDGDEAYDDNLKTFFVVDINKKVFPIINAGYANSTKVKERTTERGPEYYIHLDFDEFKLYDYSN